VTLMKKVKEIVLRKVEKAKSTSSDNTRDSLFNELPCKSSREQLTDNTQTNIASSSDGSSKFKLKLKTSRELISEAFSRVTSGFGETKPSEQEKPEISSSSELKNPLDERAGKNKEIDANVSEQEQPQISSSSEQKRSLVERAGKNKEIDANISEQE